MDRSWEQKSINNPRRSKIDVDMASKLDQFLEASWNTIFSAKRPQESLKGHVFRSAGRNVQPPGEGLGEGQKEIGPRR